MPAEDEVGAAAVERLAAEVGVVDQHGGDPLALLVGGAGVVGEPLLDLGEAEAGLVAPAAETAGARVVDAERAARRRGVDRLAVEVVQPRSAR